ncbi:MAG TPA: hypothetical protein VGI39_22050 [Polyangiaceae bacterium]|jgi:hypothetical protein
MTHRSLRRLSLTWALLAAACSSSPASDPSSGTPDAAAPACPAAVPASCPTTPSYANDVVPIFKRSCLTCHSPGGDSADVDLTTYANINNRESTVLTDVHQCTMPPTGAPPSTNVTSADRELILQWLVCGAPNN